jgi:hypothetical protein
MSGGGRQSATHSTAVRPEGRGADGSRRWEPMERRKWVE